MPSIILPSFSHVMVEKTSCLFDGVEEPCDVTSGDVFVGQKFPDDMKLNVGGQER